MRRLLVLATVGAAVFATGKAVAWVGGSSDAKPQAAPTQQATERPGKHKKKQGQAQPSDPATTLAAPEGPCDPADLVVKPLVHKAYGGSNVTIGLAFTTVASPACTFDVAPDTVVVRITSGDSRVWSSQDCPAALPTVQVVARPDVPGFAHFEWNARYSAAGCPAATRWALPAKYHVQAAAYGSAAGDLKFDLLTPQPQTIAPSPTPSESPSGGPSGGPSAGPSQSPNAGPSPSATPTKKRHNG